MLKAIDVLKQKPLLQLFTVYLRFLIGSAFVIAAIGMGKLSDPIPIMNSDSYPIDASTPPIILFFKVMSESGIYWKFIGWSQIVAGALLMTQKYAKLGALIFFGLILNIFVITLSYNFKGTPYITGLMLFASIYLIIWDMRSFQFLFREEGIIKKLPLNIAHSSYWCVLGVIMLLSAILMSVVKTAVFTTLATLFIEGLLGLVLFFLKKHKKRLE